MDKLSGKSISLLGKARDLLDQLRETAAQSADDIWYVLDKAENQGTGEPGEGEDRTNIDLADGIENRASFCIAAISNIALVLDNGESLPDETPHVLYQAANQMREIREMALKELTQAGE